MSALVDDEAPLLNPYRQQDDDILSKYHPINLIRRTGMICLSLYAMHHLQVYHHVMHSPTVNHEWFKACLASCIAILFLKAYIELYNGKLKKKTVNYQNFRQETHIMIALLTLATVCLYAALIPHFGVAMTIVISNLFGFGVVLQLALLVPTQVQNIAGVILMTLFIQEYW